jgi:capsular polysaccharide biosynthesis protein
VDLNLYGRVLWRFKYLVATGFVVAVLLAILAAARVSFSHGLTVTYRKPAIWQSQAALLITQRGFPYGRLATTNDAAANGGQFTGLVSLYARFVNSDAVQARLHLSANEAVVGQSVVDSSPYGATALPILGISGYASTPPHARELANRGVSIFKTYIDQEQRAAGIPAGQRIVLQQINAASPAVLFQGHKKTLPILAFMTVVIATLGLAFLLENMRPRAPAVSSPGTRGQEPELLQKSA